MTEQQAFQHPAARTACTATAGRTLHSAAVVMAVLLAAPVASAQQAVIDHCRKTSSDADRIACLEAALLGRTLDEKPAPPPPPALTQVDPPSMSIDAGPAEAGDAEADEPEGIGADQVIARSQTREEIRDSLEVERNLRVASYDVVPFERLVVTLENGQVWRQIKGDTQRLRVDLRRNQTVDISESSISGYKLRLNEMRRTIRVERIR